MRHLPIVPEVLPVLAALAAAGLAMSCLLPPAGILLLALTAFVAFFFRDPERRTGAPPEAILAPADGRVVEVDETSEAPFFDRPARRVSIFLSPFDVHLNRSPIAGRVTCVQHAPGKFRPAFLPADFVGDEARLIAGFGLLMTVLGAWLFGRGE